MVRVRDIIAFFQQFAPPELAESWDNVGLLIGDPDASTSSALTCLTLTPNVADEAIAGRYGLIVSHHPVLFRPVQRLTTDTSEGRMLLSLIHAGITVFCPHTRYDSAEQGINAQLAELFDLRDVRPLRAATDVSTPLGAGRWGRLAQPLSLRELVHTTKSLLKLDHLQFVGDPANVVTRLGIACGAAAEFLRDAAALGCEALLTGEARFHSCLEAQAAGIALILPGHYATERPAMEWLAKKLSQQFAGLTAHASSSEADPVQFA